MEQRAPLSFGALLKRHRRDARLTQEQLAEQAGYSVSYISMLERGERVPVRATVELLADALGLTSSERATLGAAVNGRDTLVAIPNPPRFSRITVPQPPLLGRTAEIARIDRHLTGDGPPLLLFSGEPGIGKSRLLAEARSHGIAGGWVTLASTAQRGGSQQPYTPLLESIERHITELPGSAVRKALSRAPWLTRLLPELTEVAPSSPQTTWALPPEQERRLIFTAVAQYLAHVGGRPGPLLILDDLQWAGADALDLLASLLRSPLTAQLRVVGAYRDGDLRPDSPLAAHLSDMAASGTVVHYPLNPLSPDEALALAHEALPDDRQDDAVAQRIVSRSAGVPFYLVSFAQSLAASNGEGAYSSGEDVPWEIAQTIRQRIATLPAAAHETLELAALAGPGVKRALLYASASELTDEYSLAISLDAACRAHLLVEEGDDAYTFVHDLTRDVVLRDIGSARRAALSCRIAETLERSPGEKPVEALAYHFLRGGRLDRAVPYLEQAAKRARGMQAFSSATARYRELCETLDQLARPHEAAIAREQLGEVLTVAGHYSEAVEALESAVSTFQTLGDQQGERRVVAQIGLAFAASGDAANGIQRLEPLANGGAHDEKNAATPAREDAELWDALAQLYNVGGRYTDQLSATMRATHLAEITGDARLAARVQMRHGNALRMLGRMREATTVLEAAIRSSVAASDDQTLAFALENASVVFLLQGELQQTSDYVRRALDLSKGLGDPIVLALMTLRRGMTSFVLGSWDDALADYQSAEARMREVGPAWVSAYTLIGLGQLNLARGESESGSLLLSQAVDLSEHSGDLQALRWAQTSLAEYDLLAGRPQAARQRLEPLLDRPGQQEGLVTYLLPYLAWACAASGDQVSARAHLHACLTRAEAEHIHLALVDAHRVEAFIALELETLPTADAEVRLRRALDLSHAMPYPYAEAKVLYTFGMLCRARNDATAARSHWTAALNILRHLGERLYAAHVEAALAKPDP